MNAQMLQVRQERLKLSPGAQELVQAAQKAGLKVLLVSGGFTFFAEYVRGLLNIDFVRANPSPPPARGRRGGGGPRGAGRTRARRAPRAP